MSESTKISVKVNGKTYFGEYVIDDGLLIVTSHPLGSKENSVGALRPAFVARDLLRSIVRDYLDTAPVETVMPA